MKVSTAKIKAYERKLAAFGKEFNKMMWMLIEMEAIADASNSPELRRMHKSFVYGINSELDKISTDYDKHYLKIETKFFE